MEKCYRFAQIDLRIQLPEDIDYTDEELLKPFQVDAVSNAEYFHFQVTESLPAPQGEPVQISSRFRIYRDGERETRYFGAVEENWEKAYARAEHLGKEHRIDLKARRFPDRLGANTVLHCLAAEHLIAQAGGFLLHSAYIEYRGKAILFTAPSGTGKSTQAALWEQLRGAEIINGDRAAVLPSDSGVSACGIPFAGSSGICKNRTLPLAAVVFLSQAPKTEIRRLEGYPAFRALWEGCSVNTWNGEDVRRVSEAVEKTIREVPVFHLACTPDESAVTALEEWI